MKVRIGVDLGGTKIEGIALDAASNELARIRVPTPRSYEATLEAIATLVHDIESTVGSHGTVGVAIPGAISRHSGLVKNANSTWLIGQPLDRDLETVLGREVRVLNDADCFALSEAVDGAGANDDIVFGVILGSGVGGGIVIGGKLLSGAQSIAGEWGHNPLPWPTDAERPGRVCYCGKRGCLETFLSGPGLEADHLGATGITMSAREIGAAAADGDGAATETLSRHADRLARGLATVIDVLDPHVVVLGGGVSNLPSLESDVGGLLPRYVFTDTVATRIARNVHGDSSGVRGAAWLWAT